MLAAARGVSERTAKEYDDDEARLVAEVGRRDVETGARLMRAWVAAADPDADDASHSEREERRKVDLSTSLDGMGFLDGLLTTEANAILRAQLEAITDDLHRWGLSTGADGTRLTAAQLRHDALVEMARRAAASATAVDVRRDARRRAEEAVAARDPVDAEGDVACAGHPADEPDHGDRATESEGRADIATDPAGQDPLDVGGATGGPSSPEGGSDPDRRPDAGHVAALLGPDDEHDGDPGDGPPGDQDPCSHQTAAQGLLLPPGLPPPGAGPPTTGAEPDDKVAGGLGRPLFTALIDLDTLEGREPRDLLARRAEVVGVGPLSDADVARHLCDAGISRVVTCGRSLPLDVGAVSRTATPAQWRALIAHSATCEFPFCTAPWEWCEAHHLEHWTATHRTALDGLALECSGHHHLLHRPGWSMARRADLTTVVTRPDGTTLTA